MRSGDKRIRRDDHLALQFCSPDGNLERHGAIARGDAVLDAQEASQPPLEFLNQWTVVGQPSAIDNLVQQFYEALAPAKVGTPHMQRLRECRAAAKDGQFLDLLARQKSITAHAFLRGPRHAFKLLHALPP